MEKEYFIIKMEKLNLKDIFKKEGIIEENYNIVN